MFGSPLSRSVSCSTPASTVVVTYYLRQPTRKSQNGLSKFLYYYPFGGGSGCNILSIECVILAIYLYHFAKVILSPRPPPGFYIVLRLYSSVIILNVKKSIYIFCMEKTQNIQTMYYYYYYECISGIIIIIIREYSKIIKYHQKNNDFDTWTTSYYGRRRSGYAISVHARSAAAAKSDGRYARRTRTVLINDYDARVQRI